MRVPFIGGSNTSRSVQSSVERLVNMYVELDRNGKFQVAAYGRPGLDLFVNAGSAEVRGLWVFGGNLYAVVGSDLKKIASSGGVTTVGSGLGTSTGPVSMASNPTQLILVDGDKGYTTTGTSLTEIADTDFPDGATHVVYIDGHFVVNDPSNPGRAYSSALNDGTTWAALDFGTASRDPDPLKAILVDHRELWLLGDFTTEVFGNTGALNFPFEPIGGGFTEVGIAAPYSAAKAASNVFWLAQSREGSNAVFHATGFQGQRISTAAVEEAIAGYSTTSDAFGWTMYLRTHLFYVLTFPTAGATWVYDATTGFWTEWRSYQLGRFIGNCHAFFNGKHYVGDYRDGNIFELSFTAFNDNGLVIERERWDRHIVDANNRAPLFHNRFELEFEAGVGTATLDPQAMLSWSDTGGRTWSNEHWRGIGKVGEYRDRAIWNGLGRSIDRVYRVKMTDNCKTAILGGWLDVELGQ